ncbi:alpha/beta hydrolase [Labilibaculum sp.]|uniref:alpha/beta fold hydrolase n=1 Tax=Labilibaculum sp. TaxID=2060723 RepID=UPI002AA61E39|nr:alpha/beta hydrolase [Labilibaculum sp.]MBN2595402.1 alpha/beta hydrolase [Marinifilaceae bacterium]
MRRRIIKLLCISGFAILLLFTIGFIIFQKFRHEFDNQNVMLKLHAQNIFPQSEMIPYGNYQIHSNYIGDLSKPKVLLIHGSPGYWFDFKYIFADKTLQKEYCIISYDRPGYGKTTVPAKARLRDQAKVAATVLNHYGELNEKFTIVGHSYGGAVLEQTILDFQTKISHAIYLAPCLSPKFQKAKWYNLMISGGITNKIVPFELQNSNIEMMALEEDLGTNEERLHEITIPTSYIQGKKDVLVPYQTQAYYLKFHKNVDHILLEDLNHFIPWSNPELIVQAIKNANSINGYSKF